MIEFRTLGSPDLTRADRSSLATVLSHSKRIAFLSYLALARPRGFHRRDTLIALFWPEADQAHARQALRQMLYVLRQDLGDGAILRRGDEDVALSEAHVWCDAVEFEAALDAEDHQRALDLYRGDLLMGLHIPKAPEFDRWLDDERVRLREREAGAAWALAHDHIQTGRLVDAERTAQRAILSLPTDESEARRFIEALTRGGDRGAAIRFYDRFAERLETEYDITPSAETAALLDAVRKGEIPALLQPAPKPAEAPTPVRETAGETVQGAGSKVVRVATLVVVVVALLALATMEFFSSGPTPVALGDTRRLTQRPGMELDPALSPDGTMLAYVAQSPSGRTVYVKQVPGGASRAVLEGFDGEALWPRWSPDGQTLAFVSGQRLYTVLALGGVPRPLWQGHGEGELRSPTWSPDGGRLAYAQGREIFVAPTDGSQHRRISTGFPAHGLAWSPDGSWIAYVATTAWYTYGRDWYGASSLWLIRPIGGDPIEVVSNSSLNVSPTWGPGGGEIFFVSNQGGGTDIFSVRIEETGAAAGDPERLTVGSGVHTIHLAADVGLLAYSRLTTEANLYSFELPATSTAAVTELEQFTFDMQTIESFSVSPNGEWIAFCSDRSGNYDIYKMRLGEYEPVQLTTDPSDDFIGKGAWSPDGAEIAFHSLRTGNRDLFLISTDGGTPQQLTVDPANDRLPTWSPSGREIAWRKGGDRRGIYTISRSSPGGPWGEERVLRAGGGWGTTLMWSPNGRYLGVGGPATRGPARRAVIDSRSGEQIAVWEIPDEEGASASAFAWDPAGDGLYSFASDGEAGMRLWMGSVEDGSARDVATLPSLSDVFIRDAAVHGNRVFLVVERSESNVWVAGLLERE
jgi:serine/threonine-protein kinase